VVVVLGGDLSEFVAVIAVEINLAAKLDGAMDGVDADRFAAVEVDGNGSRMPREYDPSDARWAPVISDIYASLDLPASRARLDAEEQAERAKRQAEVDATELAARVREAAPELLAVAKLFRSLAGRLVADGYLGDGDVIAIHDAVAKAEMAPR
jgi:hypothetical protein